MRLISQDGIWDIPYERVIVAIDIKEPTRVRAYDNITSSMHIELGTYDSVADVKEMLMEMMAAYRNGKTYFHFP